VLLRKIFDKFIDIQNIIENWVAKDFAYAIHSVFTIENWDMGIFEAVLL